MKRTSLVHAIGFLGALAFACVTQAAPTYAFTTDASSYKIAPGGSQVVHVYLRETGATPSSGIKAEGGLLGVGFSVARGAGPGTIASFAPNSTTFNTFTTQSSSTINAAFKGEVPLDATAGPFPDAGGLIDLGTITVTSAGPASTTFSIGDYGPGNQTATFNGTGSLDAQIVGGSFTLAVPEPASIGALTFVAFAITRRRRASSATR